MLVHSERSFSRLETVRQRQYLVRGSRTRAEENAASSRLDRLPAIDRERIRAGRFTKISARSFCDSSTDSREDRVTTIARNDLRPPFLRRIPPPPRTLQLTEEGFSLENRKTAVTNREQLTNEMKGIVRVFLSFRVATIELWRGARVSSRLWCRVRLVLARCNCSRVVRTICHFLSLSRLTIR